ncbi:MAG: hypothetical protein OEO20_06990 [Gemmatimonadota bacterium]|nr:hypothetical protein [Gemmatimonadota bacterium]MDH3367173.1 hypothetical protein [Gemmatimonadota bacterium]MDH3478033.1 hypothetical protein [Gemmatimonadota bacterium]MDH3569430.1 hypothetical protein [Gemmatimonadota bacterium]MDH5549507.1 hypothetical protein [Gemmatimonadota bacterium]
MTEVGLGLGLTATITAVVWLVWGAVAAQTAAGFGLLATVLHSVAVALLKPALKGSTEKLMGRWAAGMGLRLLGVVVFGVLVMTQRDLVPPLPAAIGFAGVLLPLLFSEMRLLR